MRISDTVTGDQGNPLPCVEVQMQKPDKSNNHNGQQPNHTFPEVEPDIYVLVEKNLPGYLAM